MIINHLPEITETLEIINRLQEDMEIQTGLITLQEDLEIQERQNHQEIMGFLQEMKIREALAHSQTPEDFKAQEPNLQE